MRIGDTIDASLLQYDPTPFLRAQSNATATIGASMSGLVDKFAQEIDQTKQFKDEVKAAKESGKALKTLDPALEPVIDQYLASFDNPDASPRQMAIQARQMPAFVEMWMDKQAENRGFALKDRAMDLDEQAQNFNQFQQGAQWDVEEKQRQEQEQFQEQVAPSLLDDAIKRAKAAGVSLPFADETLNGFMANSTPRQKAQMWQMVESYIPQPEKEDIREAPVTIDGQPGKALVRRKGNGYEVVPITEAAGNFAPVQASQLPAGLRPYADAFNKAGEANGVDPRFLAAVAMHETGGGTSPAFRNKNNAMGISDRNGPTAQPSVETSIDRQARSLSRPGGHYNGLNTIAEIGNTYAPSKGATNDPRGLNKHWPAGVSKYYEQLGGNPKGSVRAGAANSTVRGRTPTQEETDKVNLQIAEGQLANQKREQVDVQKGKDTTLAEAQNSIRLLDQLVNHTGFEDVFGVALGGRHVHGNDGAGADALYEQIKNRGFLDSIEKIRGTGSLSNAEGEKLMNAANRLDRRLSENEAKGVIEEMKAELYKHIQRLNSSGAKSPGNAKDASYYKNALSQ